MGGPPVSSSDGGGAGVSFRDAESLFRTKPILEIRNVEAETRRQIQSKQEELRQLVGTRYRDLIDSADSIVLMKSSCQSISSNLSSTHASLRSLSSSNSSEATPQLPLFPNPARASVYGIACRVKYLIDTPENIWGRLDESMFLEAAARYVRAKQVQQALMSHVNCDSSDINHKMLSKFPLLQHQWQIVESFRAQISQRSRERLLDRGLSVSSYADALAAVAVIDELQPKQILGLFLETRKSWISQKLCSCNSNAASSLVVSIFCEVLQVIQVSVGQVGESFLQVLNDMPVFYKVVLGSPPAFQLFGGIPDPDEEVRLWNLFRDKLECVMVILNKDYIARTCSNWLRECGRELLSQVNGRFLIDAIGSGQELASAEKLIRETMESKEVLEGSLEWLKSVFGSEIELPWRRMKELVLEDDSDLWDEIFEDAFTQRMKSIIDLRFEDLSRAVKVADSVLMIDSSFVGEKDIHGYLNRATTGGEVWFVESSVKKGGPGEGAKAPSEENLQSCLNVYFGNEVSRIKDAVDSCCQNMLDDLLSFLESPKADTRLKDLAPYLQNKCYESISAIFTELEREVDSLYANLERCNKEALLMSPAVLIERSLFIGRLLYAFQYHSKHIPVVLGSPRFWINDSLSTVLDKIPSLLRLSRVDTDFSVSVSYQGRKILGSTRRQNSWAAAALLGASESESPKLEELSRFTQNLCIRSYELWISWLSQELSIILSRDLYQDDSLSSTMPLRGWEETVLKQGQSEDGQSDLKVALPSTPSLYILSFLFKASKEIHKIGGHVLDKTILQKFALKLTEKVIDIYGDFLSTKEIGGFQVSEKGILQILLDIRFVADVLSGGDSSRNEELHRSQRIKFQVRRKQDQSATKSISGQRLHGLLNRLSQVLDPIDWLTYEPYLWENERQAYLRHAVLFGFFMQLNRMYTDTVQKLPTNSESNIMRCSMVPRFNYLPISAPALSSRGVTKVSNSTSADDLSRNSWKDYTNGGISHKIDLDENSSLGVAAPLLKSFMQVGSRFGESTLKFGSMLTDGQVGIFKDKSAAAMSTFGDILPAQAAGLLSSFTSTRSDS